MWRPGTPRSLRQESCEGDTRPAAIARRHGTKSSQGGGLELQSGYALPPFQATASRLTLIDAQSHLDCRAAGGGTSNSTSLPTPIMGLSPRGRVEPWNRRRMLKPWQGLSPRGRGNRHRSDQRRCGRGSIPARAGEPGPGARETAASRVYPRAGGGTPALGQIDRSITGSIPARAGEPTAGAISTSPSGVYPRAGGGTTFPPGIRLNQSGLSPRGRGNPPDRH